MTANFSIKRVYKNSAQPRLEKNKPNQTQFAKRQEMNANVYFTRDYENQPLQSRPENTPSQTQCQDGEHYNYDDPVDANLFSIRRLHHADDMNGLAPIRTIMLVFTTLAKSQGHENADFYLE